MTTPDLTAAAERAWKRLNYELDNGMTSARAVEIILAELQAAHLPDVLSIDVVARKVRIEIEHWAEMWHDPLLQKEDLVRAIARSLTGQNPQEPPCDACNGRGKISVGTPWAGEPICPVCADNLSEKQGSISDKAHLPDGRGSVVRVPAKCPGASRTGRHEFTSYGSTCGWCGKSPGDADAYEQPAEPVASPAVSVEEREVEGWRKRIEALAQFHRLGSSLVTNEDIQQIVEALRAYEGRCRDLEKELSDCQSATLFGVGHSPTTDTGHNIVAFCRELKSYEEKIVELEAELVTAAARIATLEAELALCESTFRKITPTLLDGRGCWTKDEIVTGVFALWEKLKTAEAELKEARAEAQTWSERAFTQESRATALQERVDALMRLAHLAYLDALDGVVNNISAQLGEPRDEDSQRLDKEEQKELGRLLATYGPTSAQAALTPRTENGGQG